MMHLAWINDPLLAWYDKNARDLPWRHDPDAYRVWVSEIMLQQTRVETVRPYYRRFLEALPDVGALARCPEDKLLKLWEGLGYYSRVRNMQRCAKVLIRDFGGAFPRNEKQLLSLPGIGPYTAGAIASIAFGEPVPAVDGNVMRVISRAALCREDILLPASKRKIDAALRESLPQERAGAFNQALMDLGATVCLPGEAARCEECPLQGQCPTKAQGLTGQIPVRQAKTRRKIQERTVLVIRDGERTVLCRRPSKGLLAGLYEPPCMEGRADADGALSLAQSCGVSPLRIRPLPEAKHVFTHLEWHMTGYDILAEDLAESPLNRPSAGSGPGSAPDAGAWFAVETKALGSAYAIPSAYRAYMSRLTDRSRT